MYINVADSCLFCVENIIMLSLCVFCDVKNPFSAYWQKKTYARYVYVKVYFLCTWIIFYVRMLPILYSKGSHNFSPSVAILDAFYS